MVMVIVEGFNVDRNILEFLKKIITAASDVDLNMDFLDFLDLIADFVQIAQSNFNLTTFGKEWDKNWIKNLESPKERLFANIDKLISTLLIQNGKMKVKIISPDFEFSEVWHSGAMINGKLLDKTKFSLSNLYKIESHQLLYIPIAVINTYAILKKGFIRKGGDEFESYLLINPFFKLNREIDHFGYPKAFSYIDIEEKLKEKDLIHQSLNLITNVIESDSTQQIQDNGIVLPEIFTQNEIEEFVQNTYDMYELVQEGASEPVANFQKNYKNIGIAKNLEKLSGELVDIIYLPALLLEYIEGKMKKEIFIPKSELKKNLLLPYNLEPKDPWNRFMKIHFNINNIENLISFVKKFQR